MKEKRILLAMSGGVDSSVSAVILGNLARYKISGATMKLCDKSDDFIDAEKIAKKLGFEYYLFDFREDFYKSVIKRFASEYVNGRTPNPCVYCNKEIKFNKFLWQGIKLGYDFIATGHYAKIEYDKKKDRYLLKKARDKKKDQSYFLYNLRQEELKRIIFPLGDLLKDEVREIAEKNKLVNAKKKDSQDICFIRDRKYVDFLLNELKIDNKPGNFIDKEKNIIGKHKGIISYTIGQRKKLGINLNKNMYVIKKNKEDNSILLGEEKNLYREKLIAGDLNWILIDELKYGEKIKVKAKIRYSQEEVNAWISLYERGENRVLVEFEEKQRAISPGQAIVFYIEENVLGGGIIFE